jgi:hypothetical protein
MQRLLNNDDCNGAFSGKDTKAIPNNSSYRYKRSSLERATIHNILWCMLILAVFFCDWRRLLRDLARKHSRQWEIIRRAYLSIRQYNIQVINSALRLSTMRITNLSIPQHMRYHDKAINTITSEVARYLNFVFFVPSKVTLRRDS